MEKNEKFLLKYVFMNCFEAGAAGLGTGGAAVAPTAAFVRRGESYPAPGCGVLVVLVVVVLMVLVLLVAVLVLLVHLVVVLLPGAGAGKPFCRVGGTSCESCGLILRYFTACSAANYYANPYNLCKL